VIFAIGAASTEKSKFKSIGRDEPPLIADSNAGSAVCRQSGLGCSSAKACALYSKPDFIDPART
jgi:hypothetical protein